MAADNPIHVMLDIETMGKRPGSAVLSIGAVAFDPRPGADTPVSSAYFHRRIALSSCLSAGLSVDADTVEWWLAQSDAARAALLDDQAPLDIVLRDFGTYLGSWRAFRGFGHIRVWSNGASFDPVLLEAAYRAVGMDVPWGYREVRCARTLFALAEARMPGYAERIPEQGPRHDALADARWQALMAVEAVLGLGLDGLG